MSSVFSRILARELPGTFVHEDVSSAAIMSINPVATGHVLVVPRLEVDQWIDLDDRSARSAFAVARRVAGAQRRAFGCDRVGFVIAGFEVAHCHLHLIPANTMDDLDFARAATDVTREDLESAAAAIRRELGTD